MILDFEVIDIKVFFFVKTKLKFTRFTRTKKFISNIKMENKKNAGIKIHLEKLKSLI